MPMFIREKKNKKMHENREGNYLPENSLPRVKTSTSNLSRLRLAGNTKIHQSKTLYCSHNNAAHVCDCFIVIGFTVSNIKLEEL